MTSERQKQPKTMGEVLSAFAGALDDQHRRGMPRMSVEQVRRIQQVVKVSAQDARSGRDASKARTAAAAAERRDANLAGAAAPHAAAATPELTGQTAPAAANQRSATQPSAAQPPAVQSPAAPSSIGVQASSTSMSSGSGQTRQADASPQQSHPASLEPSAAPATGQRSPAVTAPAATTRPARVSSPSSDMPWAIDEEAAAIENARKAAQKVEEDARAASDAAEAAVARQKAEADAQAAEASRRAASERAAPAVAAVEVEVAALQQVPDRGVQTRKMEEIRMSLGDCTRCALSDSRTNLVFGEGDPDARLMIIGEAPSRLDDARGRLFSDEAGELLTAMLRAMGLGREQVYTTSILKCRPPNNRAGERDELMACARFLRPQIETVQPEVIITLGSEASRLILGSTFEFSSRRGEWGTWEGVPVMPTWHPGYLVHHPAEKRSAWADLQLVMGRLGLRG